MRQVRSWEWITTKLGFFLPKNRFARNTLVLSLGTAVGQGLGIAASPVLSRLYSPNDFGILAVYASILAIFLNISSFRYEFAIPLPEDNQTAVAVLVLCMVLVLSMGFVFGICAFLFHSGVIHIERIDSLKQYFWLLPIGFVLGGLYQTFNYWGVRERIFPTLARTNVAQGVTSVLTQLGFGLSSSGPLGLLLGQIFGQSAGLRVLASEFWKKNGHWLRSISLSVLHTVASRYKRFPLYQSTASLLNAGGLQVPSLLFAAYYGIEVVGWFFLTQKVLAVPISLIGTSVSKVFLGESARLLKEPLELRSFYRGVNRKLFLLGLVPVAALAICGKWLFGIVFGHGWEQSGLYVQVMAFVFLVKLTADSVINFAVIERQDLSFFWALTRLILVILGIGLAARLGMSDFWAIVFFSIAMISSYILKYVMWEIAINQMISARKSTH